MHLKLFEVRDRMTFMPCFAFLTTPGSIHPEAQSESFLLHRAGFDPGAPVVVFGVLTDTTRTHYDPFEWADRTLRTAHEYVFRNWHGLVSGDVIDVEFILGERSESKLSERFR